MHFIKQNLNRGINGMTEESLKTLRLPVSHPWVAPSDVSQDTYITELFGVELGLQQHGSVGDCGEFSLIRMHFVGVLEEKTAVADGSHCNFLFLFGPHQCRGHLHPKLCFL